VMQTQPLPPGVDTSEAKRRQLQLSLDPPMGILK